MESKIAYKATQEESEKKKILEPYRPQYHRLITEDILTDSCRYLLLHNASSVNFILSTMVGLADAGLFNEENASTLVDLLQMQCLDQTSQRQMMQGNVAIEQLHRHNCLTVEVRAVIAKGYRDLTALTQAVILLNEYHLLLPAHLNNLVIYAGYGADTIAKITVLLSQHSALDAQLLEQLLHLYDNEFDPASSQKKVEQLAVQLEKLADKQLLTIEAINRIIEKKGDADECDRIIQGHILSNALKSPSRLFVSPDLPGTRPESPPSSPSSKPPAKN